MQRQRMKENVERGIQKGASNIGRGIWSAAKYVGRAAGRRISEGIERTFNEPINPHDRETFERARGSESRRYWKERARSEYRRTPRYVTPSVTMFGGGTNPNVSMTGGTPMVGKKRKEVSMI